MQNTSKINPTEGATLFSLQTAAFQTPVSPEQSAPASPTALSSAADVRWATLVTASRAKTSTSAVRSPTLATLTMESTAARTQSRATTACPAPHVSPDLSLSEGGWNRQQPKNRHVGFFFFF